MSKKVVRLTESQLKGIVAETVKQVLNEKHLLMEMSYPRNVYKDKMDSEATRRKVLLEVLRENDFDNPQFMTLAVCNKFIEENIDVKTEFFQQTVEDCIANIGLLFDLILSRDVIRIARYAETI